MSGGEQLRERILKQAEEAGITLTEQETDALERACTLADAVDEMDRILAADGLSVPGPGGIIRAHPLVAERKSHQALIQKLSGPSTIKLDKTRNESTSQQARRAAKARWGNKPSPANITPIKDRKLPDAI